MSLASDPGARSSTQTHQTSCDEPLRTDLS